jgi:preprotein translocase subunit SecD
LNKNNIWKIALILAVLVVFTVAIIPTKTNPEPIRRGLDLKGGIHLVMRVNVNEATRLEVDQAMNSLRSQATSKNVPVPTTRRLNDTSFVATPPAGVSTAEYERSAGTSCRRSKSRARQRPPLHAQVAGRQGPAARHRGAGSRGDPSPRRRPRRHRADHRPRG